MLFRAAVAIEKAVKTLMCLRNRLIIDECCSKHYVNMPCENGKITYRLKGYDSCTPRSSASPSP